MNAADWDGQFNRIGMHFRLPADADRERVSLDWYHALEHYHVDAVERGITELVKDAEDTYWPALGKLVALIRGRIAGMEKFGGKCQTCHGSTWIEDWPHKTPEGMVYEYMQRCPDCGVPAPQGGSRKYGLTPLTASEKRAYDAGEWPCAPMEGVKPKPKHDPTELRAWCAAMAVKLFGGRAA